MQLGVSSRTNHDCLYRQHRLTIVIFPNTESHRQMYGHHGCARYKLEPLYIRIRKAQNEAPFSFVMEFAVFENWRR